MINFFPLFVGLEIGFFGFWLRLEFSLNFSIFLKSSFFKGVLGSFWYLIIVLPIPRDLFPSESEFTLPC